ncbi:MAG: hypothetical protein RIQ51_1747, partial [Bacteroidota bacterium]
TFGKKLLFTQDSIYSSFLKMAESRFKQGERKSIAIGIAVEIPDGYVGILFDKSGLSHKHGLKSYGGIIDAGYRGEIHVGMMNLSDKDYELKTGDTEGLVNYLLSIHGIKFAAIVIDREEERKWSFRSKGNFDVNIFARTHFEGGGHANAAGGSSKKSVDETFQDFKTILETYKSQLTQLN